MNDLWRIVGIALCAVVTVMILRETRREFVPVFVSVFSVAVLTAVLPKIASAAELIKQCASITGSERIMPAVKALGITYLTSSAADLCRSLGESSVASAVETAGRAEILLLCVPLLRELVDLALVG